MAGELCPYCGTLLTESLKFCVTCRRSVTESRIKLAGADSEDGDSHGERARKYRLARKTSYDGLRQARNVFTTLTVLIGIFFVYYFTMKFMIHEPIPCEEQVTAIIEGLQKQIQSSKQSATQKSAQPNESQQEAPGAAKQ